MRATKFILLSALSLGTASIGHAYPPSTPDVCETQEGVTICSNYGRAGLGYRVEYRGYLIQGPHSAIRYGGNIDGHGLFECHFGGVGRAESPMGIDAAGKIGFGDICGFGPTGRAQTDLIQVYFADGLNRYDSHYGYNYRFEFRFNDGGNAILDSGKYRGPLR